MNKLEWMPSFTEDLINEAGAIAQLKLLRWLIAHPTSMNLTRETIIDVIYVSKLESMLRELEKSSE